MVAKADAGEADDNLRAVYEGLRDAQATAVQDCDVGVSSMTGHFDQHIKLRDLILEKHPKVIVEVGAGDGDNTQLLAHLHSLYPFKLYSISDKKLDMEGVEFIVGISYEKLKEF